MSPWVGVSSASSRRMNVDLPEPDGPIRKTNSPLSILSETLSRAGRAEDLYSLLTWSRVIITARQCSGGAPVLGSCRYPGGGAIAPGTTAAAVDVVGVPDLLGTGSGVEDGAVGLVGAVGNGGLVAVVEVT